MNECAQLPQVSVVQTCAATVQLTVAECVSAPETPVTFTLYVPAAAVPGLSDSVDEPEPEMLPAESVPEPPDGTPLTESATAPEKPFTALTEIADVPLPLSDDGLADIEKS